jgi:NADH-quinone oxidoreductase subunit G
VGGRSTVEDAYAYARFARVALGSDNIDFRVRESSGEEAAFLAAVIAGSPVTTTYESLEHAPIVVTVALEPEDESPIVFLRLRKAARAGRTRIVSVGAVATKGLSKVRGELIASLPGGEAKALQDLPVDIRSALGQPGAVILVGERIAAVAGGPSAVAALAAETGASLAWVPRRAGERGALDAGALSGLLPGGRLLLDPAARSEVAAAWGIDADDLPTDVGLAGEQLLMAAREGRLAALITGGVELADYPDHDLAEAAIDGAGFVIALENHHSAITERADVVFPVAVVTEKSGTFLDWEGRPRPFAQVFRDSLAQSDAMVLGMIATTMERRLGVHDVAGIRRELGALGPWGGQRATAPAQAAAITSVDDDRFALVAWRALIDAGVMQEGEPFLAATARPVVAAMSARTAASIGNPAAVIVTGPKGSVEVPVQVGEAIDGVVVLPLNSPGCSVYRDLGVRIGDAVSVRAAEAREGGRS